VISYAQNQEDVMLARALAGTTNGFYIDVGAHDPAIDSVTQHFYDQGWRGVNIEPVVRQCQHFVMDRPLDVNLAVALGRREGRLRFHDFSPHGLSTFDIESARRAHARGYASHDYDVPVTTLAAVCAKHAPDTIDFLKIDVEGMEADVIAGADWSAHRPRIVVVEATRPLDGAPSYAEWEPSLIAGGYLFVWFDGVNRFYLRREDAPLARHFNAPPNAFDGFQIAEVARLRAEIDRLRHSTVRRTIHDLRVWARARVDAGRKAR